MKIRRQSLLVLVLFLAAFTAFSPAQTGAPAKTALAKATVADADKLDINTATPAQLKGLKGIGDAYSKRIVDGRPYTVKNQLVTRGILPAATYEAVKDQIIARAVKK